MLNVYQTQGGWLQVVANDMSDEWLAAWSNGDRRRVA
jgi:hypothetical protein